MDRIEKIEELGELIGRLRHGLKNSLSAIKIVTFYLRSKLTSTSSNLVKYLDNIDDEVSNANRLISEVLYFARPQEPVLVPIDLNEAVDEVISEARSQIERRGVKVHRTFDHSIHQVSVDKEQLKQALLNVILNGVHVMSNGGALMLKTRRVNGDSVQIEISDTGRGIPPENIDKIFDPFFTTKANRLGLGLTVTKSIIERHFGTIKVNSIVDTGTTVLIELPIKEEEHFKAKERAFSKGSLRRR